MRGHLVIVTILNLRGVHDAGTIFAVPTYLFVGSLLIIIGAGILRVVVSGGHPAPITPLPMPPRAIQVVSFWLLLSTLETALSQGQMKARVVARPVVRLSLQLSKCSL